MYVKPSYRVLKQHEPSRVSRDINAVYRGCPKTIDPWLYQIEPDPGVKRYGLGTENL